MGNNSKVFARKMIWLFGGVVEEDIEREAAAIVELCKGRQSGHVVDVINSGWLAKDVTG